MSARPALFVFAASALVLASHGAAAGDVTAQSQSLTVMPQTITLEIQDGYQLVELSSPSGKSAWCLAISKDGIVGGADKNKGSKDSRAAVWHGATPTYPRGTDSTNSAVVGFTAGGEPVGYAWDVGILGGFRGNSQVQPAGAMPLGIGPNGKLVGMKATEDGAHALPWAEGVALKKVEGFTDGYAFDENNAGTIVGYAASGDTTKPVTWGPSGNSSFLPGKPNGLGAAYAVNNGGTIVGHVGGTGSNEHAARWDNGQLTELVGLGGKSSAVAINTSGSIVGSSDDKNGNPHGVIFRNNKAVDLNTLIERPELQKPPATQAGLTTQQAHAQLTQQRITVLVSDWFVESAGAINDKGEICGWAEKLGVSHAVVLKPVTKKITVPVNELVDDAMTKSKLSKDVSAARPVPAARKK